MDFAKMYTSAGFIIRNNEKITYFSVYPLGDYFDNPMYILMCEKGIPMFRIKMK